MKPIPVAPPRRIFVLKTELLYAETLAKAACRVFPLAEIAFANRIDAMAAMLRGGAIDLLVTGLGIEDSDVLDFLFFAIRERSHIHRVLVATGRHGQRFLDSLWDLPVDGIYDSATGDLQEFERALRAVVDGAGYLSREFALHRTAALPADHPGAPALTPSEQLVLAAIGDGCDDQEAGERLGLKASTVHSTRRELHRKLRLRHRGELMRHAVREGYVRFTDAGVQRPGYSILLSACARPAAST
jgi:DNA-binding NarL/FixJ family response regulator